MSKKVNVEATVVDVPQRLNEITSRIGEIQAAMVEATPEDGANYLAEFKELMAEAATLSKKGTTRKAGTGAKRESKLGALKGAKVLFMPRNTVIELEGELVGVAVDKRNGFHIATVAHATGLKFTKKIDQLTVVDPTDEQEQVYRGLVADQENLIAQIKEEKAASAEVDEDVEGDEYE